MMKKMKPVAALVLILSSPASADTFNDINGQIQTYCDQETKRLLTLAQTELNRHAETFSNLLLSLSPEQRKGLLQAVDASVTLRQILNSIHKNRDSYSTLETELRENTAINPDAELDLLMKMTSLKAEHKALVENRDAQIKAYRNAGLDSLMPKNGRDSYQEEYFVKHSAELPRDRFSVGYAVANDAQNLKTRPLSVYYESVANIDGLEYKVTMLAASDRKLTRFSPQFVEVELAPIDYVWLDRELSWDQRQVYKKAPFCRGVKSSLVSTQLPKTLPFAGFEEFSRN